MSRHSVVTETIEIHAGTSIRQLSVEGSGPVFVLLHGVYDRADTWLGVLERLAAAGRRAVAIDLPAVHLLPRGEPILPRLDDIVAAVIRAQGPQGVVLSGNSMGAGLTLRAAADPELPVRAAVPLSVPGFGYRPVITTAIGRYGPGEVVLSGVRLPARVFRGRLADPAVRYLLYTRGSDIDPDNVRSFLTLCGDTRPIGRLLAGGRTLLREFDAGYPEGPLPPTLIVHGRHDKLIPHRAAYRAQRRFPSARVLILPASAHCPQVDDPATITRILLEQARRGEKDRNRAG
ncbi:alpha/beta hydrolase [Nocardia sp. CDC159]|uniref:Alpha/beta hydrolase n=1 Tax=Nocardia pulmonis TaxID=2951408 RepID=A0A9X2IXN9_9NOCA|nr:MULTISPECIES: alpha/beta hydrolase [Nocardia]MCM6776227.1 alpha/beta hydrolase [Nocardia pulmonis]MCM6788447.1 alpha/beta hydrolase [Nocardia sp. CDC159]